MFHNVNLFTIISCFSLFCMKYSVNSTVIKEPESNYLSSHLIEKRDEKLDKYTSFLNNILHPSTYRYWMVLSLEPDQFDNDFLNVLSCKHIYLPMSFWGAEAYRKSVSYINYPKILPQLVMLNVLTTHAVKNILRALLQNQYWKRRSNVIFVIKSDILSTDETATTITKIFRLLWESQITNTYIVYWNTSIEVFTYNPFLNNFFQNVTESFESVVLRNKARHLFGFELKVDLQNDFSNSILAHINEDKHQIKSINEIFSHVLRKYLNATFLQIKVDGSGKGHVAKDGSVTGNIKYLASRELDIALNTRILRDDFGIHMESSYPIGRNDLCLLAPKARKRIKLTNIFKMIEPVLIIANVVMFTCSVILSYAVQKMEFYVVPKESNLRCKSFILVFMDTLQSILRQSVQMQRTGWGWRSFKAAILLYALVMNVAFEAVFTSSLTSTEYAEEVDSITKAAKDGYRIIVDGNYKDLFAENLEITDKTKIEQLPKSVILEKIVNKEMNTAFVIKRDDAKLISRLSGLLENGRPLYHTSVNCPIPCLMVLALSYGSPYVPAVNNLILRCQESGLRNFWIQMRNNSLTVHGYINGVSKHNAKYFAFGMADLQLVTVFWITGIVISILVFLVEVVVASKRYNVNNNSVFVH